MASPNLSGDASLKEEFLRAVREAEQRYRFMDMSRDELFEYPRWQHSGPAFTAYWEAVAIKTAGLDRLSRKRRQQRSVF